MSQYKLDIAEKEITERITRFQKLQRLTGLSKKEFAQLIGKSSRIVHFWETGSTPISERNVSSITNAVAKFGIICSESWLLHGSGTEPIHSDDKLLGFKDQTDDIFEHFNLDFSLSGLLTFYRKIYPEHLSYLIEDYRFAPRIIPSTLLIAVEVPQDKYRNPWIHGYLHRLDEKQIIPIDIEKREDNLYATPFAQPTYVAKPFVLEPDQKLYPIINIRPVY